MNVIFVGFSFNNLYFRILSGDSFHGGHNIGAQAMLQNTPTIPGGEHQMVVGVVSTMRLFAVVFHILETLAGQGQSFQWIHYIPVLKHGVLRRSNKKAPVPLMRTKGLSADNYLM